MPTVRGVFVCGTQRLIVDARSINQRCRLAPPVHLCIGDGLGRIELSLELTLHGGQLDVDNRFHFVKMLLDMQRWFSLLGPVLSLGGVGMADGFLNDETLVFPLLVHFAGGLLLVAVFCTKREIRWESVACSCGNMRTRIRA